MKILALVALLACGAFAAGGPQCQAPNGGGLQPILEEFISMSPIQKILELLFTSMTSDPETQAVMEYLSSFEFHQILIMFQNRPEFKSLLDFACNDLYIDVAYYFNVLAFIFGFPEARAHPRVIARGGGFHGLLREILDLIPLDDLKALWDEKLATDCCVQLTFKKMNSDEFRSIVNALKGNDAYIDMNEHLRGLGVDVDLIIDTINRIFH
ncbi:unnamed protein product [Hermetia illucens]|uniref:Uncharacterized protein n=1 Tax=Hermetia illucens TaxID=343691 RepID=A0A7R8URF3_HERIL|nr:uncharacterized protein LOC119651121 [Hermetia illucens]CAD7085638.1 unnamed protein product [Hermetia illucens]